MSDAVLPPGPDWPPVTLIAAVARNGVIGADNQLPWSLPSDLKHFRACTMGKPVVLGRHTYDSIGRPLPGRHLIVLSRDSGFAPPGVTVAGTLAEALAAGARLAREHGAAEIMVAGGGRVYAEAMGLGQRLLITEVDCAPAGDTRFPPIDPALWRETSRQQAPRAERDTAACTFVTYARR